MDDSEREEIIKKISAELSTSARKIKIYNLFRRREKEPTSKTIILILKT
jgi:hypothetical protein